MFTISLEEFRRGYLAFQKWEKRDAMYSIATFLVNYYWGNPAKLADSVGVLLLTWNNAFYRYGLFNFEMLEQCIRTNLTELDQYRKRTILDYEGADSMQIQNLFEQFREASKRLDKYGVEARSPVSVAKALHMLAPGFFPLWDSKIAKAYGYNYSSNPKGKYVAFCEDMKEIADKLHPHVEIEETGKTLLKLIDEYNYAKYTQNWI